MKNLSINISGIIFYVEAEAYSLLKDYLQAITQYFAKFEDSREIVEDIENRVAEIFISKLENNNQALSLQDVEELMATMGSISDFEEAEEDPLYESIIDDEMALAKVSQVTTQFKQNTNFDIHLPTESEFSQNGDKIQKKSKRKVYAQEEILDEYEGEYQDFNDKRLYRDSKRRFFGGVAAGIAHYLQTDPIWIRLCFVVLFTGLFFIDSAPQVALILYVVGWIFLPKNANLEENSNIKKFYRDEDKGVLGGVSAGLAKYFGVDEKVLRFIFLGLTILYGSGVLVYMFMWFTTPVAKSITEKMQLEGKPITLANIETSVKRNLQKVNVDEESIWSKIALFPFRALSFVIYQIQSRTQGFVHTTHAVVKILIGIFALLISLPLFFGLSGGVFGASLGLISFDKQDVGNIIIHSIDNFYWLVWSLYLVLAIPTLSIIFFGIKLLTKYKFSHRIIKVVMTSLWIVSFISLMFNAMLNARNFKTEGTYQTYQTQKNIADSFVISAPKTQDIWGNVTLKVIPYDEKEIKLVQYQKARGKNEQEAIGNAQYIVYKANFSESNLSLPKNFGLKKEAKYRFQDIHLELYMPKKQKFILDENMAAILRNTLSPFGYTLNDLGSKKNVWQYNPKGELECLTCKDELRTSAITNTKIETINANGNVEITLIQSNEKKIVIPKEFQDKVSVEESGETFNVQSIGGKGMLTLYLPSIEEIELDGACKLEASGFEGKDLEVNLTGATQCIFKGKNNYKELTLEGNGASYFEFLDSDFEEAKVNLTGASKAHIWVNGTLDFELDGASELHCKGSPDISKSLKRSITGSSKYKPLD